MGSGQLKTDNMMLIPGIYYFIFLLNGIHIFKSYDQGGETWILFHAYFDMFLKIKCMNFGICLVILVVQKIDSTLLSWMDGITFI